MSLPVNQNGRGTLPRRRSRRALILASKLTLGIGLVGLLIWSGRFDPRAYSSLLHQRTAVLLLGVFVGQGVMLLVPLVRWWLLIRAQGVRITVGEAVRLGLMGAFANLFVPGTLGIDGLRLVYLRRFHREKLMAGAASVFMDRALGLAALLALGSVCSVILLIQARSIWVVRFVASNGLLLLGLSVGLAFLCGFLPIGPFRFLRRMPIVDQAVQAMHVYRGQSRTLALGFLLSLIGHCGVCFATCFALLSLGYPAFAPAVFAVTPIVLISRTIPLTPLGLGVSDGVAAFLYPIVGLQGGAEIQMLLRVTLSLVLLTSGLAYFTRLSPVPVAKEHPIDIPEESLIRS